MKMNKKGDLKLRDIMFMIITFSLVMSLASVIVLNMANEYVNTDMRTTYYADGSVGNLGDTVFVNVSSSLDTMGKGMDESVGSFNVITGAIKGVGTILVAVISSPKYIATSLATMATAMHLPSPLPELIGNPILAYLIVIITFVIISAFLKGGKV